ncbi:CoA-binding protein [Magnetospirillum sp. SS-4]|uniref:CoA-binding protein n=1 Tax=Magnetospirillum sp. SS-4 TaxID=2681465 RepID=UPI0013826648|nr:CoA-binding protein [Magnetospirillum sp. SS-4]CAA7627153.1 Organic acid-CoA ligase [Magnetospirillum sp. SS-4]
MNAQASGGTAALEMIGKAMAAGRRALDQAELATLLGGLGIGLDAGAAPAAADLRIALADTREFGMVISAGLGGIEAEISAGNFKRDRAVVHASVELTDGDDFLALFKRTYAYQKQAAAARRAGGPSPDAALAAAFSRLIELGRQLAVHGPEAGMTLTRLDLDPAQAGDRVVARAASCELGAPLPRRLPRPIGKIDKLIHPEKIGIIGVSASGMNFGRIILRNLMGSGCAKERLVIIRPEETEIDGVKCVESLKALDGKLDLLIVAVAAGAVYGLVDELIETDKVNAVMLIPGSLGETKASKEPAAVLAAKINAAHANPGGGPIFLGANCLGVVSHPGGYDSWFIPLERLPKPRKKSERNSVLLSQSGAFMITRLSRNPWLDPNYMMALGNQTDLTHGDMLTFFSERPGIETIGVYVEGFKDLDGLDFVRAVRRAVLAGKQVVVYKSGKTAAGQAGVMGHTASIAGDLGVFESVIRQAGGIVAEDLDAFDDLFYMAGAFQHKSINGNRLGGVSGAGFEAVGIADSTVSDTFSMEMGALTEETVAKVRDILVSKKLDALVEVRNSIDINPGADDEAHLQITEAFIQDPNIDAVVVGMDPTAPSVMALEESKLRPGVDLNNPKSSVFLMPPIVNRNDKPIVAVVDGGPLYDAMAGRLMDQGVCVFRNCVRATKALTRYVEARLDADRIRKRG